MQFLIDQGWDIDVKSHARHGGAVLGLCGGYQMLGRHLFDPDTVDGNISEISGLGLLDIETVMHKDKTVREIKGKTDAGDGIEGYEIHVGKSDGPDTVRPFVTIDNVAYGASALGKPIWGSYLHGIFASDAFRASFLKRLSVDAGEMRYQSQLDRALDDIAASYEEHLDIEAMFGF
jgi:adenosylcobyric acid synthase